MDDLENIKKRYLNEAMVYHLTEAFAEILRSEQVTKNDLLQIVELAHLSNQKPRTLTKGEWG